MDQHNSPLRNYLEKKVADKGVRNKLIEWFIDSTPADSVDLENDPVEKELYAFWESSLTKPRYSTRRADEVFAGLKQKITGKRSRLHSFWKIVSHTAAILLLPLLITVYYFSTRPMAANVKWVEVYAPYGETRHVTLPDGSTIMLNSGTHVFYPDPFFHDRQIFVSGEVFLDVVHVPSTPFFVDVRNVNIEVLGTRFNVRSYTDDRYVETSLLEGSISLGFKGDEKKRRILLEPGDRIFVDNDDKAFMERFDISLYSAWNEGYISFINKTLGEIAKDLERIFDVQIVIHDKSLTNETYFASLGRGWSLDQILKGLNMNGRLRIRNENRIIEIWRAGN